MTMVLRKGMARGKGRVWKKDVVIIGGVGGEGLMGLLSLFLFLPSGM